MRKIKFLVMLLIIMFVLVGCENKEHTEKIATGMQLIEELNYEEANTYFENVLLEEANQEAYRGQGIAYIGLGEYSQAIVSFQNALACAEGAVAEIDYDINYYMALAYYKDGQFQKAKDVYSSILALKEKEKDAILLRGKCSLQLGGLEEAIEDFERYLALDDKNLEHYIDIYKGLNDLGYTEEGEVYLNKALSEVPKLTSEEEGTIYYYLGDYVNAKEYLEAGSNERNEETTLVLGKTYEALGSVAYAVSVYLTYIEEGEPSAEIYNQLAMCKMLEESYEEALTYIQEGFKYADLELLQVMRYNEIVIYEYAGQFTNAKTSMDSYSADYPGDVDAIREAEFLESR